ncbi:MAG: HEAT repeat domain-containing protein [Gammaproteobacteria bacterium]
MKPIIHSIALLLIAAVLACSREPPDEKTPAAEKNSDLMTLFQKHNQESGSGVSHALSGEETERFSREREQHRRRGGMREDQDKRRGSRSERQPLSPEEIQKNREERAQRRAEQLAEARKNISSLDDELRLNAVSHLDTDNAGDVKALENALANDPAAEIREEAAVQLSFADKKLAEPALIKALNDPEPAVVVAAIEALTNLEGKNKGAIIDAIKQLGSHPDEDVRDAMQTALEDME